MTDAPECGTLSDMTTTPPQNGFSTQHPHERDAGIPPIFAPDGHCVVCRYQIGQVEAAVASAIADNNENHLFGIMLIGWHEEHAQNRPDYLAALTWCADSYDVPDERRHQLLVRANEAAPLIDFTNENRGILVESDRYEEPLTPEHSTETAGLLRHGTHVQDASQ